jgi:hypothetical protein
VYQIQYKSSLYHGRDIFAIYIFSRTFVILHDLQNLQ